MNKKLIWGIVIVVVVVGGVWIEESIRGQQGQLDWKNNNNNNNPVTSPSPSVSPTPSVKVDTTKPVTQTPVSTPTTIKVDIAPVPVATAPVKGAPDTSSWKSYLDTYLKISAKYPADWELHNNDLGPNYSFWFTKTMSSESVNLARFAKVDGCKPNKEILIDGVKAYDSGWRSSTHPTRSICLPDKNYIIDLTAADESSRVQEDAIVASVKFTN
jgi:hypothetical protein